MGGRCMASPAKLGAEAMHLARAQMILKSTVTLVWSTTIDETARDGWTRRSRELRAGIDT